jgi:hypothetical protein
MSPAPWRGKLPLGHEKLKCRLTSMTIVGGYRPMHARYGFETLTVFQALLALLQNASDG